MLKKVKKDEIKLLPFFDTSVSAGFPSPAEEELSERLDLNQFLITHPASTFFIRVKGDSMLNAGIISGDILMVDRSLEASDGDIVLAVIDSEFTVKRLKKDRYKIMLVPENDNYSPIIINDSVNFLIWGVVTSVIRKLK